MGFNLVEKTEHRSPGDNIHYRDDEIMDDVLGLPVYETNKCDEIIGLPGITGVKLYMIAVSMMDRGGGYTLRWKQADTLHLGCGVLLRYKVY